MIADRTATDASSAGSFLRVNYPSSTVFGVASAAARQVRQVVVLHAANDHLIVDDDVPAWARRVLTRLAQLERLAPNWDSYGGRPLSRRHRDAALDFLGRVMADDVEVPDVVPLADGGLQLEWRRGSLEVDFISDEEVGVPILRITDNEEEREFSAGVGATAFADELRPRLRADGVLAR